MDYLKHIKEDLTMHLYNYLEANEDNSYKNVDAHEIEGITHSIKNIAEAIYYCTANEKASAELPTK